MKKSYIVGIVVIIIVGAGAYFLGMSAGKASAASTAGAQFAQFAARGGAASGKVVFGGRAGAAGGGTLGQIVSVSDNNMVIEVGSSTQIVLLTPSTSIQKTVSGSQSDLGAGETVTVAGTSNSDGSVTADSVQIRPAASSGSSGSAGASTGGQNMRSAPMMPVNK
ncbi:MAG: hypothetical protein ACREGH_00050 [Minisyncoccia bacterium]